MKYKSTKKLHFSFLRKCTYTCKKQDYEVPVCQNVEKVEVGGSGQICARGPKVPWPPGCEPWQEVHPPKNTQKSGCTSCQGWHPGGQGTFSPRAHIRRRISADAYPRTHIRERISANAYPPFPKVLRYPVQHYSTVM